MKPRTEPEGGKTELTKGAGMVTAQWIRWKGKERGEGEKDERKKRRNRKTIE